MSREKKLSPFDKWFNSKNVIKMIHIIHRPMNFGCFILVKLQSTPAHTVTFVKYLVLCVCVCDRTVDSIFHTVCVDFNSINSILWNTHIHSIFFSSHFQWMKVFFSIDYYYYTFIKFVSIFFGKIFIEIKQIGKKSIHTILRRFDMVWQTNFH